jgi:thiamine-phosphate pyrophosphorylase
MIYLVLSSEYARKRDVLDIAEQAIEAGIDMLQIREKSIAEEDLLSLGKKLLCLCRDKGIPFIVNDNPEIAKKIGADGVHLGQEDIKKFPLQYTRSILGKRKIIGISTHSLEQFQTANSQDFNYIAFGPIFPTKTKDYCIGMDGVEEVLSISSKQVIFIGGINTSNVDRLIAKGAGNIAVIRAIMEADDIKLSIKKIQGRFLSPRRFVSQSETAGAQETGFIKVNGKEQAISYPGTIFDLINSKGLDRKAVVVEHNYNIVPKEKWHETVINKGDNIEIVSFVGGG